MNHEPNCIVCHSVVGSDCGGDPYLLCGACNWVYSDPSHFADEAQKKRIAVALSIDGVLLPHHLEVMLTQQDHEDIIRSRIKRKITKHDDQIAQLEAQFNSGIDYLFEERD